MLGNWMRLVSMIIMEQQRFGGSICPNTVTELDKVGELYDVLLFFNPACDISLSHPEADF